MVLAVHHASFKLLSQQNNTTIPFYTYVATTAPLELDTKELLPFGHPVYDTQFQIDYYRPVFNNRLFLVAKALAHVGGQRKL